MTFWISYKRKTMPTTNFVIYSSPSIQTSVFIVKLLHWTLKLNSTFRLKKTYLRYSSILHNNDLIHFRKEANSTGDKDASLRKKNCSLLLHSEAVLGESSSSWNFRNALKLYLLSEFSAWSDNFIKYVFSNVWFHITEWIVQQVNISIKIHRARKTDTLFLPFTQIYIL